MFEYVASGLSFLRVRFAESHKSPTADRLNNMWSLLRGKYDHEFSFLYNAFIEKEFGDFFYNVYRGKGVKQIYADSGGLQMITLGKTITPQLKQDVYTNQGKYSDCAMTFDEIPVSLVGSRSARSDTSSKYFDREKFEWCARESGRNVRDQIETFIKLGSDAKPMFIAQGADCDTYIRWVELALEEVPKELHERIGGVAMGAVALGTGALEDCKRAFYYSQLPLAQNNHHLHLLGVGSVSRLVPILAMKESGAYHPDIWISYDSTTHTSGVQMGRYYGPNFEWVAPGRDFGPDYIAINADIRRIVTDYIVDDRFFHEAMNVPVRAYQRKHNGEFLPPIEAFSAFFVASTTNFMQHVDTVSKDFMQIQHFMNDKEVSAMKAFCEVKTMGDFMHWEKEVGSYLASSPVRDGLPATLPEDF